MREDNAANQKLAGGKGRLAMRCSQTACGRLVEVLRAYDFTVETRASGTNLEGDERADVLSAVQQVHERLHGEGTIRSVSYLKPETRTDKVPTPAGKRLEVRLLG